MRILTIGMAGLEKPIVNKPDITLKVVVKEFVEWYGNYYDN